MVTVGRTFVFLTLTLLSSVSVNSLRIECLPDYPVDNPEGLCSQRGCIFEPSEEEGVPWCFFPENYGYKMSREPEETEDGLRVYLARNEGLPSLFGEEFDNIVVQAEYQTNERLRVRIFPDGVDRFEVPVEVSAPFDVPANSPLYKFNVDESDDRFFFEVIRESTGTKLFSTDLAGLILSSQFLQLPFKLPTENVYGIGETYQNKYRHSFDYKEYYLYARDQPPVPDVNLYGVHPQYTVLENDGNAHSVLILNSNAQEFNLVPGPAIIYRTIGGILDLYFFLGPSPDEVNQQYSSALGKFPVPPYWSLGFQLCRYGYNTLENMQMALGRTRDAGIPVDVQYGDIDIMHRNLGFTVDQDRFGGLPEFVDTIKRSGMKFLTILNPFYGAEEPQGQYRPYDLGEELGVWVRNNDNDTHQIGDVWPIKEDGSPMLAKFVDFSHPNAAEWWSTLIRELHDVLPFDGLWIDMNEPINFNYLNNIVCDQNKINFPPYATNINFGNGLVERSLCPDSIQTMGLHYDVHSLFGWAMSPPTLDAVREVTDSRGWVLSRSTFPSSGQWIAHWLGDNFSQWPDLKASIVGMLEFNRFGIPLVGSDICGFIYDTERNLCARWHLLGAFYTFSRNHNGLGYIDQDPGAFDDAFEDLVRDVYNMRYRFLPYYYTLFFKHYTKGSSVVRALWDEFPRDEATWDLDEQFLVGKGLMVSPVLEENAYTKTIYFPDARWYSITRMVKADEIFEEKDVRKTYQEFDVPIDIVPLHVRGGIIYPLQLEAPNTELSRLNDWTLLVALDDEGKASGELFWDDGNSLATVEDEQYTLIEFELENGELSSRIVLDNYSVANLKVTKFEIVGVLQDSIESVQIGNEDVDFTFAEGRLTVQLDDGIQLDQPIYLTYE